jgi:hypothetical protein
MTDEIDLNNAKPGDRFVTADGRSAEYIGPSNVRQYLQKYPHLVRVWNPPTPIERTYEEYSYTNKGIFNLDRSPDDKDIIKQETVSQTIQSLIEDAINSNTKEELALGFLRYESLRKIGPNTFSLYYKRNMSGIPFDSIVDESLIQKTEKKPGS